jgi:predicted ester cyclase
MTPTEESTTMAGTTTDTSTAAPAEHERRVRTMYDAWNDNRMEDVYATIDEHVLDHNADDAEAGLAGVRLALDGVRRGFPDLLYTVEHVAFDGVDVTAARLRCTGTHTGDFFGIPPTGRAADWRETRWARWRDGRVVEHWATTDSMTMMRQLGLLDTAGRDSW